MCINDIVNCTCGFVGGDPNYVIPDWIIVTRNSSGVVVSNVTVNGGDIIRNTIDGLEWIPDLANPNNSLLRIGPVNETANQSSYQCRFTTMLSGPLVSKVGTVAVLGEKICSL